MKEMNREEILWTDYPELTPDVRTIEEDEMAEELGLLYAKFLFSFDGINGTDLSCDLQAGIHLLQGTLITIQKRRLNKKKMEALKNGL